MKSEDERVKTLLKKKGLLELHQKHELNESKVKFNYYIKQIFAFILGIAGVRGFFYIWTGLDTKLGPAIDAGNIGGILAFTIISILTICCLVGAGTLYNSTKVR